MRQLKRFALELLALSLPAIPAAAQPTLKAHTIGQCLASNTAFTTGSACGGSSIVGSGIDTTGASLLIACPMVFGAVPGAVSDSKGNTWTPLTAYTAGQLNVQMWYAIPSSTSKIGTGHTFTTAAAGGSTWSSMGMMAFVGSQATTAYRSGSDTGNDTTHNLSLTPGAVNDLLVSCLSNDTTTASSINSGFTLVDMTTTSSNGETGATAWLAAASTSAVTFVWSPAIPGEQAGAAFEVGPAPTGGGGGAVKIPSPPSIF
jgi:hypothetical protein